MGRHSGILFKLVEEAAAGSCGTGKRDKANWSKVFHYLEAHSFSDANVRNPTFDSPLPPFTAPNETLSNELLEKKGGARHDSTVLKVAVCVAPAMIVAALLHLQPKAAAIADHQGRIPLHLACRRSYKDSDTRVIFNILISSYKKGLIQRDSGGRTPLHYLFGFHAQNRTPEIVEMFCQTLPESAFSGVKQPKAASDQEDSDAMRFPLPEIPTPSQKDKIPMNAAIVHDAIEGSLPLHYAVVKGASRDIIKMLLDAYPDSKYLGDRRGRTALALYFGAGLLDVKIPRNVNGDPIDPNDIPYWDSRLESATVKLLLSSRVARTSDYTGRYPLHWACSLLGKHYYSGTAPGTCLSIKAFQLLKDHHVEALLLGDLSGKTPLHHLFDSVRDEQQLEWQRLCMNKVSRDDIHLVSGGPSAFSPPLKLVELLLSEASEDRVAASIEDNNGRLPIHAALEVATCAEVVKFLIKTYPASLLHTTEEQLVSPLHAALISPFAAPLQTVETMELVLEAYVASRHGSYIDGRLALKMEDTDGNYPIHYACRNQACLDVIRLFVDKYPKGSLFQNADGDLPLHAILDEDLFSSNSDKLPIGASLANSDGWDDPKGKQNRHKQLAVIQEKVKILIDPILASSDSVQLLKVASSTHDMLPLHIAVAFGAASYSTLYTMLDLFPEGASKSARANGGSYSTLDLHNMHRSNYFESDTVIDEDWHSVRELLFSFHPLDNNHRHDEDLLAQSVRLVRSEIRREGSYHLTQKQKMAKSSPIPDIELTETLKSIELPELETGGRPFSRRNKNNNNNGRTIRKTKSPTSKKPAPSPSNQGQKEKSIYDDDGACLDYVVSEAGTESDDESFSGPESAEEYMSDEYEENESFDDEDRISWDPSAAAAQLKGKGCKRNSKEKREQEEKKEDPTQDEQDVTQLDPNKATFSEVAMRILSFFILYCDSTNPSDNYAQQVESILDDISRSLVDSIISQPVPEYAAQYFENVVRLEGLSFRELASPKSREVIKKLFYFLGRFEFDSENGGILLHRSSNNSTVLVRATEWTFTTEEYKDAPKLDPGVVEAEIWETGVVPTEKVGFMGSTFRAMKRSICFLFTKHQDIYNKEVECRSDLGVAVEGGKQSKTHVIPLITHFNAHGMERSQDKHYKMDTNNDTFSTLHLFGGKNTNNNSTGESICLAEYPYALTFPYSNYGDLFDYFFRHGVEGPDETKEICSQIGKALRSMHEKGIVHGNICMRNIALHPSGIDSEEEMRKYWGLTTLSGAFRLKDGNCFLGAIYNQGTIQFNTSSLPPEMFMKLSNSDLKKYNEYWDAVERIFEVKIDKSVIKPVIDFQTGDSYVMRCHFVPSEADMHAAKKLPPLPYKRVPARESSDIWAFGQLLFMLSSSGRPLFPTNARTGHLLNYREISLWDMQAAENLVYENVEDPLTQDILLLLLAPYEERVSCNMKAIMGHPFFLGDNLSPTAEKIVEQRKESSNKHILSVRNKVTTLSEDQWLREKTVSIDCWDFDFLARFHLAPTSLIPQVLSVKQKSSSIPVPCSFILLPYKLSLNKKLKLTPGTKKDVERAEKLGMKILNLCKACQFVNLVDQIVSKEKSSTRIWGFSEIVREIDVAESHFGGVIGEMERLAAHYVELFRYDPVSIGIRVVQGKIKELLSCFDDSKKVWLYLVDEYHGVPVVESVAALYPHLVPDKIRGNLLQKGLPFMYLCTRYCLGVSGGVLGLVKLIFEAAYPHIPPSWQAASVGLNCTLDGDSLINDVKILRSAMFGLYETKYQPETSTHDLEFMLEYLQEIDAARNFAKLERVSGGGGFIWTTTDGVSEIKQVCESYSFQEAFGSNLKKKQMLEDKDNEIQKLKEELEKLKFRKDLNLEVPEVITEPEQQHKGAAQDSFQAEEGASTEESASPDLQVEIPNVAVNDNEDGELSGSESGVVETPVSPSKNVTVCDVPQSPSDETLLNKNKIKLENSDIETILEASQSAQEKELEANAAEDFYGEKEQSDSNLRVVVGQAVDDDSVQQKPSDVTQENGTDLQDLQAQSSDQDEKLPADSSQEVYYDVTSADTDMELRNYHSSLLDNDLDELMAKNDSLLREVNAGNCQDIQHADDGDDWIVQQTSSGASTEGDASDALRDFFAREVAKLPTMETKLHNLQDELEKMRHNLDDPAEKKEEKEEEIGIDNFFLPELLKLPIDQAIANEADEHVMKSVTTDTTDASDTISDNDSSYPVKS